MSDINPKGIEIEINGVKRHFLFTLNVMAEIQDEKDVTVLDLLDELIDPDKSVKAIRYLVTVLINDEIERTGTKESLVTEKQVGWWLSRQDMLNATRAIMQAYGASLPDSDEEDENPNQNSVQ